MPPVSEPYATALNPLNPNRPSGHWQPSQRVLRGCIPSGLAGWLLDTASLTLRLQRLCPGKFRVRVLSQQWGTASIDEAQALRMKPGCMAVIRQVQLLCGGEPWVYARTVIPATSLRGRLRRLAHLGTRPLGGMLFSDPGMRRASVELVRLDAGQPLYRAATRDFDKCPAEIWGRRAVFRLAKRPLLVSEIFLPAFPAGTGPRPARLDVQIKL
jgi:chorismate--pyruvate lyase